MKSELFIFYYTYYDTPDSEGKILVLSEEENNLKLPGLKLDETKDISNIKDAISLLNNRVNLGYTSDTKLIDIKFYSNQDDTRLDLYYSMYVPSSRLLRFHNKNFWLEDIASYVSNDDLLRKFICLI